MKWLRWLKPDTIPRPQDPKPSPRLYDWQQDADVISDFSLWDTFTLIIDPRPTAVFVSPNAVKPEVPKKIVRTDAVGTSGAKVTFSEPEEDAEIHGNLGSERCVIEFPNARRCPNPAMTGRLTCYEHCMDGEDEPA